MSRHDTPARTYPQETILPAIPALLAGIQKLTRQIQTPSQVSVAFSGAFAINFLRYAACTWFLTHACLVSATNTFSPVIVATLTLFKHAVWLKTAIESLIHATAYTLSISNEYNDTRNRIYGCPLPNPESSLKQTRDLLSHYLCGQILLGLGSWCLTFTANTTHHHLSILLALTNLYWMGYQFFQYPLAGQSTDTIRKTLKKNNLRCLLLGLSLSFFYYAPQLILDDQSPWLAAIRAMTPYIGVSLAHEMKIKAISDGGFEAIDRPNAKHWPHPIDALWSISTRLTQGIAGIIARFGKTRNPIIERIKYIANAIIQATKAIVSITWPVLVIAGNYLHRPAQTFCFNILSSPAIKAVSLSLVNSTTHTANALQDYSNTIAWAQYISTTGIPGLNWIVDVRGRATRYAVDYFQALGLSKKLAVKLVNLLKSLQVPMILEKVQQSTTAAKQQLGDDFTQDIAKGELPDSETKVTQNESTQGDDAYDMLDDYAQRDHTTETDDGFVLTPALNSTPQTKQQPSFSATVTKSPQRDLTRLTRENYIHQHSPHQYSNVMRISLLDLVKLVMVYSNIPIVTQYIIWLKQQTTQTEKVHSQGLFATQSGQSKPKHVTIRPNRHGQSPGPRQSQ